MDKFYNEIRVTSDHAEILRDFVFELGFEAVEICGDGEFVVRDEENLDNLKFALESYASALSRALGEPVSVEIAQSRHENRDWIENYRKSVRPILAGLFYIRPSWCAPYGGEISGDSGNLRDEISRENGEISTKNNEISASNLEISAQNLEISSAQISKKNSTNFAPIDIIIDPALAFGSGHHESTNMCLQAISKHAGADVKTALDVGCGSGILSIALAKMGIATTACDTDIQAVEATLKNADKNGVCLTAVTQGSAGSISGKFDLITANIIADVILIIQHDLKNRLNFGGTLIVSGILKQYFDRIMDAFSEFLLVDKFEQNEWLTLVYKGK